MFHFFQVKHTQMFESHAYFRTNGNNKGKKSMLTNRITMNDFFLMKIESKDHPPLEVRPKDQTIQLSIF